MTGWLRRYEPYLYALLRIVAGFLYWLHGTQKVLGFPPPAQPLPPMALTSLLGVAGLIELVAGILIVTGLFTSCAAFVASGEMAVAYFLVHDPQSFWPLNSGGEPAALNCFVFLYIAAAGPGRFSLDRLRHR